MAARKKQMVTTVFRDRLNAERAFDRLHAMGYSETEINVLMSDKTRSTYYADENHHHERFEANSAIGEGVAIGGAVGTAVGATLAAVAAVGTSLLVPGLGIIVAGPVAAALAGGGAGAVTGGIVGGLIGLGVSEDNAKAYEAVLRDGGVVLGVTPHNTKDANRIRREFENLQGENIIETAL